MSNVFLPQPSSSLPSGQSSNTSMPTRVARYREIRNYDRLGHPTKSYKQDIGFEKVGFSKAALVFAIKNPMLKKIDYQLILHIAVKLEYGKDTVILNPKNLMLTLGKQTSAISESIKRLISIDLIQKIPGRCKYQINPMIIFKGKRIDYLEDIDPALIEKVKKV